MRRLITANEGLRQRKHVEKSGAKIVFSDEVRQFPNNFEAGGTDLNKNLYHPFAEGPSSPYEEWR